MLRLQFEIDRLRNNKKITINVILFLILVIGVVYLGIYESKTLKKEKRIFLEYEKLLVENYKDYQVYGAEGLRILYENSPLCILVNLDALKKMMKSDFDTSEIIHVRYSNRGSSLFIGNDVKFNGFRDLIYYMGTFLMLYLGLTCFEGINNLNLYRKIKDIGLSAVTRLMISSFFFLALFAVAYLLPTAFGINMSVLELKAYAHYTIYTLALLAVFFASGVMLALLNTNSKKTGIKYVYAVLFWGIMVIGIPLIMSNYIYYQAKDNITSIEGLNVDKLKTLMDFEKRSEKKFYELIEEKGADKLQIARNIVKEYLEKIYPLNNLKERKFLSQVERMIHLHEAHSTVFPTTYYHFLTNELSSNGNYIYLQFLNRTLKIREDFIKYYIHKRYYSEDEKIENFVKNNENLFNAQPFIPPSYPKALAILLIWLAAITLISYLKLKQITTKKPTTQKPKWPLENGAFYFMYIENPNQRAQIFNSFLSDNRTSCLTKIDFNDFEPKTTIRTLLNYWALIRKIPENQMKRYLFILGFQDAWLNTCTKTNDLLLKKLYLAAVLAEPTNLLIIHDFIKNEDQDFDEKFRELLQIKISEGKTIVYLSSIMPETVRKKAFFKKNDTNEPVKVENARILSFR
jgi:hypothetical protein